MENFSCFRHQGLSVPKCFLWYGIMWEAKGFVSTCVPYNRNKCPKHHVRTEMTKYHAGTLIERVHLDSWDHSHGLGSGMNFFGHQVCGLHPPTLLDGRCHCQGPCRYSQTKGATLKMKTVCSCVWPSADTQGPHHPLQSTGKWTGGSLQLDPYGCVPVLQ